MLDRLAGVAALHSASAPTIRSRPPRHKLGLPIPRPSETQLAASLLQAIHSARITAKAPRVRPLWQWQTGKALWRHSAAVSGIWAGYRRRSRRAGLTGACSKCHPRQPAKRLPWRPAYCRRSLTHLRRPGTPDGVDEMVTVSVPVGSVLPAPHPGLAEKLDDIRARCLPYV